MSKPTGFLEHRRRETTYRAVAERIRDYGEIATPPTIEELLEQAGRCMDCGIPFCHGTGCPLGNVIPEVNDLAHRGRWREALEVLHTTNNFPEFTGRLCPALCEASCTLGINDEAVTIREIELEVVERGWRNGWIAARRARKRTGRRVAIVGSGPAGLAAAQELARMGHEVAVYEESNAIGGLLRYGIPDFKLEKSVLDRRLEQMEAEGVRFETGVRVGRDVTLEELEAKFDAVLLTTGAGTARELEIPGRELGNVHLALEYLTQQNRANAGEDLGGAKRIDARDKVVVIGGGDTGSDCVGTANRQGAREVHQLEILPKPSETRTEETPWPTWPNVLRTSSSHKEGCQRQWSVLTKRLSGTGGVVRELHGVRVEWTREGRGWKMTETPGSEFSMRADLVLIAMGFTHTAHEGLVKESGIALDARGNILADEESRTSRPKVFVAGDAGRGASLVAHALASGREAARAIDRKLK